MSAPSCCTPLWRKKLINQCLEAEVIIEVSCEKPNPFLTDFHDLANQSTYDIIHDDPPWALKVTIRQFSKVGRVKTTYLSIKSAWILTLRIQSIRDHARLVDGTLFCCCYSVIIFQIDVLCKKSLQKFSAAGTLFCRTSFNRQPWPRHFKAPNKSRRWRPRLLLLKLPEKVLPKMRSCM